MGKIGLIIKREYTTRVKKKSFLLMTILGPILIVGFLVGAIWLGQQEEKDLNILVLDDTYVLSNTLLQSEKYHLTSSQDEGIENIDDGKTFLKKNDQYDIFLYLPGNIVSGNTSVGKLFYKDAPSSNVQRHLENIVDGSIERLRLKELNISNEDYSRLKNKVQLHTIDVVSNEEKNVGMRAGVGFIFGLMIYMFIFMYGIQVMKGVIEEKSNRIVEVIVSSVKPFELMMGKIIGIMFVGLTQFIIWVILSLTLTTTLSLAVFPDMMSPQKMAETAQMEQVAVGIEIEPVNSEAEDVGKEFQDLIFNQIPWGLMIGLFIFYFIGGYLLYGSLMAAVGAAVDSETDTQQFILPITAPLIFGYIVAAMAIDNPNSVAVEWCSQIPFTSPIVMLVRVSMGAEGLALEIITSMVLLIGTFVGTTWVAGRIYRTGILMYGKKASYKEMFKWLRHK
ncbi:MAG: ABC transporter permease [Flavobacteriales bacterium]|nr:ABC transporter permease [Flavobacteriales bacterium]